MKNPFDYVQGHEGEILTYRQLCGLLGLDFKCGKAKGLQLEKVRQYMDLGQTSVPRKIVIREVYPSPNIKPSPPRGKTYPYIMNALLQILQDEHTVCYTYSDFTKELGMVSKRYWDVCYDNSHKYTLSYSKKISRKYVDDSFIKMISEDLQTAFFTTTRGMISETIRSALRQMEKKELIITKRTICPMKHATYTTDNGEVVEYTERYELTKAQQEQFEKIEEDIIQRYQLKSPRILFMRNSYNDEAVRAYREDVSKFVHSLPGRYEFYATAYILSLTPIGKETPVNTNYINKEILKERIRNAVERENSLKQLLPPPMLEELINRSLCSSIFP